MTSTRLVSVAAVGPMSAWLVAITSSVSGLLALACLELASRHARWDRRAGSLVGSTSPASPPPSFGRPRARMRAASRTALAGGLGVLLGLAGWFGAGPMGALVGVVAGVAGPSMRRKMVGRRQAALLEEQLAEWSESIGTGLRSGLSIVQAMELAQSEAMPPLRVHLDRFVDELRLGVPLDAALSRLGGDLGTDDARLVILITGIHTRTGGDLAGALDEVGQTIRHRIAIRRELRAASAQGRISGLIMGALPIAFFLFLSATSHRKLEPVLRSRPGMAMVGAGLILEGLAYLWIRRLLRVEV